MLQVFNTDVYGLEKALMRARYPKLSHVGGMDDMMGVFPLKDNLRLATTLGGTNAGEGHDKFLRFILVQMDVHAPRYWWQEFSTYHHKEMMSQSTMHCITKLDLNRLIDADVPVSVVEHLEHLVSLYKKAETQDEKRTLLMQIKCNIPEGLHLTAAISTNYAQLKTIYKQRKTHRLEEWVEFCDWVETLPYAKELGII